MRNKNTAWCGVVIQRTQYLPILLLLLLYTYNRIMSTSAETFVRFPRIIPVFKPHSRDRWTSGRFSRHQTTARSIRRTLFHRQIQNIIEHNI